ELLEAELVVLRLLLDQRLHLRELELQPLDLTGEKADLLLELLDADGELGFLAALRNGRRGGPQHQDRGKNGPTEEVVKAHADLHQLQAQDDFMRNARSSAQLGQKKAGTPVRDARLAASEMESAGPPEYARTRRPCLQRTRDT